MSLTSCKKLKKLGTILNFLGQYLSQMLSNQKESGTWSITYNLKLAYSKIYNHFVGAFPDKNTRKYQNDGFKLSW